ncbi:MAG: hypothetical protein WEB33_08830 [Bacteroidota bacterium]
MLRILLWSLIAFFLIRFLWRIIAAVFRNSSGDSKAAQPPPEQPSSKSPATFRDIREAKFKDLPSDENSSSTSKSD